MQLIEVLDRSSTITIDGISYPASCILEDEDGVRINLVPQDTPAHILNIIEAFQSYGMTVKYSPSLSFVYCIGEESCELSRLVSYREALHYIEANRPKKSQFVNTHTHSEWSSLDGLSTVQELVDLCVEYGQDYLALTDHGRAAGHPQLQKLCEKAGISPVMGMEAYYVQDRHNRTNQWDYNHLILWAKNDKGLLNLWAASTESNRSGYYRFSRMDNEILSQCAEGMIASTSCLRGPITEPLLKGNEDLARQRLGNLMRIFPDLYIEIHCNDLPDQLKVNPILVELAKEYSLPLIAGVDSHYPCAGDYQAHQFWLQAQMHTVKAKGTNDDSGLFSGRQDYHIMRREEVEKRLSYLPAAVVQEALDNTYLMASSCNARVPTSNDPPIFSVKFGREYAAERLRAICKGNWQRKVGHQPNQEKYHERFEFEMQLLGEKMFHDYFLIVSDYIRAAKKEGYLIGPSRGSGGGSLVAYLADITEVDPIKYDLLFARFMTKGRVDPPDFDIDFPSSAREWLQHYVAERWGFDNIARVGSVGRLKNKGAFREMYRVLNGEINIDFKDIDAICKIIDDEEASSAGLGYPWQVIWDNNEELLAPYKLKYPLLFEMVEKFVNRIKSYGKHASGVVISTGDPLTGRLPMRIGDENQMVTEFDYRDLEKMGYLKFDLLTLRTLDTLQMCINLIKDRRGLEINPLAWTTEFEDPQVWDIFCSGDLLGVFQFETRNCSQLTKRVQPNSIKDLSDINALVRPGPKNSGMTESYIRRRNGEEKVTYIHPKLEELLKPTQGLPVYQEQIMGICLLLAGYDDVGADSVRKILGKKLINEIDEAGRKFVKGCVENEIDERIANDIWLQMAAFSRYSFNAAHSIAYSIIAFYCAWFKSHFPEEFYTACLSTVHQDRVPEFVSELQKTGFRVFPPDVNESKVYFTPSKMAVRYGFISVKGIGEKAVEAIVANQPYESFEDFRNKVKGTACNAGTIKTLAAVGAFDSLEPNRKALERRLEQEFAGDFEVCVNLNPSASAITVNNLPCNYNWAEEPVELTPTGRIKKRKEPPKRCTKACRHYTPVGIKVFNTTPYTPTEIRDKEMESLGVWLSSTPFDRIAEQDRKNLLDASQLESAPVGKHLCAGILKKSKEITNKNGEKMAFLSILAVNDNVDITCFADTWEKYKKVFQPGELGLYAVTKNVRGFVLNAFVPI